MLNLEEIDKTILDLEAHDTTYATCEKLAWLYVVRDHLKPSTVNSIEKQESVPDDLKSAFIDVIRNKPLSKVLPILDEHFQVIQLVYPKEYQSVIEKLKDA